MSSLKSSNNKAETDMCKTKSTGETCDLRRLLPAILLIIALSLFTACSVDDDDDDDDVDGNPTDPGGLTMQSESDENGRASVQFDRPSGATKLAVVAQSAGTNLSFAEFHNNQGSNYLDPGNAIISLAGEPSPLVATVNAPSRAADPAIEDGRYTAAVDLNEGEGRVVSFSVHSKADSDLNNGRLTVNVFRVGVFAQNDALRPVIDEGLNVMRTIYREESGIEVQVNNFNIEGPAVLPDPSVGSDFYSSATAGRSSLAVNLFIGGDVEVDGEEGLVLGIAANIPGPPISTARSAVAVSVLTSAGSDAQFDPVETRILGETFAHEVGHFMGLFHPVELAGGFAVDQDPLGDTPSCFRNEDCLEGSLKNNLMFPFAVQDASGQFVEQNQLSGEQRGVLNRYVAVD
jgi:hypothetical protein